MLIFRQTAPKYKTKDEWRSVNDNEEGPHRDNYSILDQLDDSMRNNQHKFEFNMRWPKNYNHGLDENNRREW